jgi:hypothetical protein
MKSFLKRYDLTARMIAPFNSNGGCDMESSFRIVKQFARTVKSLTGYPIERGEEWDSFRDGRQKEQDDSLR